LKQLNLTINIPNILTIIRILLIPLFIISLIRGLISFALLIFTIAAISDGLDGLFARYLNQYTQLGAYLDPIADKLLLTSSFICLAVLGMLPNWLTVIVITRDILIVLGLALFTMTHIKFDIKPSLASKLTTVTQLVTVIWVLLNPQFAGALLINKLIIWTTALMTISSGFHYIYIGMNIIQEGSENDAAK
jgi:cardiolipin synthase (CMP-forming)